MPAWDNDRKPTSWTARVLAPLLLVAVAAALVLVISDSLSGDSDDGESTSANAQTTETGCTPDADQAVKDGFYVVKEGDNFTTIADHTCVSEDRLQQLLRRTWIGGRLQHDRHPGPQQRRQRLPRLLDEG